MLMPTLDLQVNGYLATDFSSSELTSDTFRQACCAYLRAGADAFLPTLITSPMSVYERNLQIVAEVLDDFPDIPGLHLEGPFISSAPGAVGAHDPRAVQVPDFDVFQQLQEWAGNRIRLLTIAADVPGAAELCRKVVDSGVVVSLGHQLADCDELRRLADAGATYLTHLGNGMPNQVNRHDNPLVNGLAVCQLGAMVITDGHHLPEHIIRLIIGAKGVGNTIVVSDASPLAGMPPGQYQTLGNDVVLEVDGRLHNPAKQCLVGSSFTLNQCVAVLEDMGYAAADIKTMTQTNPGCLLSP
jgi:N-acetylglucosamine-6-phosphate deacetylase